MNHVRVVLATALALAAVAVNLEAATATWDRNPEPAVTGYRLSYGTQPGVHPTTINVGNVLTYQFFPPTGLRYYVVVQAIDSSGALSSKSAEVVLDLTVAPPPTQNQPPVMTQPANQSSVQNTAVSLALIASDPQGTSVYFWATGLPSGLTINAATGVISGTVTTVGTYTVAASVADGELSATRSFTWTVTSSGGSDTTAPTVAITAPAGGATVAGSTTTVSATAADAVGVAGVQFRLDGANLGAEDTTAPYSAVWNTTTATNGSHQLTAIARDAAGNSRTSAIVTVTVNNASTNRAPVLTQPANQSSAVGAAVSLALVASDPDGNPLTFSATGLPPGLAINTSTGLISGALGTNSAGVHTVAATASDGTLASSRTFTWSVNSSGDTPLAEDFDGDRRSDPATYRKSTGEWRVWRSSDSYVVAAPIVWGVATDIPVPADYDGDRRTDIAVYRPSTGTWHILLSSTDMQSDRVIQWGNATDLPLPLDYDRDGRADLALPRSGGFEILLSGSNYTTSVTVR